MKTAYIKNILRLILNNKRRYIAIISIVILGIAFFVGLRSTSPNMNIMIDTYFKDQNMHDIKILTTLGIDESDIEIISSVDGVKNIMPAYYCDEFVQTKDSSSLARFHSYDPEAEINVPVLITGAYPENGNECLVDYMYFQMRNCAVGDYIYVTTGNDSDIFDDLKYDSYKIVGAVDSPLYLTDTIGNSTKGSGSVNTFIYIPEESFNLDVYTEVYIKADTTDISYFSEEYDTKVSALSELLKKEVDAALIKKYNNLVEESSEKIADAKTEIADGKKKLSIALDELSNSQRELDDAENELLAGEETFAKQQADFYAQFPSEALPTLPPELIYMYNAGVEEFEKNSTVLLATRIDIDNAKAELQSAFDKYYKGKAEADEEFAKAETEIADYEDKLAKLMKENPESYVLDLNSNIGFVSFKGDSERIDAISYVFPLIFFLVASLVTLTNMLRIVEDDRSSVGVLKSLGYGRQHIFAKYIFYVVLVTIPGSILGVLAGYDLFPSLIYNNGYRILYNTPKIAPVIQFNICIYAAVFAFLSIVIPTIAVCYSEIISPPANLIRPKSPQPGKRVIIERISFVWNKLNFFAKVTSRNILRYKKRFFMTVIGIAGCTALLVTGFGIIDSIKYIAIKQFSDLFLYDGHINLESGITDSEKTAIEELLAENNNMYMYTYIKSINAESDGKTEEIMINVLQDSNHAQEFYEFRQRKTGIGTSNKLYLDDSGVIMTEKICSMLDVKVGDTIMLTDADNKKASAKIIGICENYTNNYVYMTPELYSNLFQKDVAFNSLLCKDPDNTKEKEERLSVLLLELNGVSGLSFNSSSVNFYTDMLNSLNFVVVVLVLAAAALAFTVLFSLTAINIDERTRELATLKVLGFYNRETTQYIFRENSILTVIGTLTGLIMGIVLHRYVITTVEIDIIMFARDILPLSYIYSALLTFLFSIIVNIAMSFSIKKINMVESLKSIE